jgi:probable HAF family extracellular repeat protein
VSEPVGINDRGQVLVNSYDPSHNCAVHAFVWENGRMRALGTLGGTQSLGRAIDNRGQVIGESDVAGESGQPRTGFLWERGQMTNLSDSFGEWLNPYSLTDSGEIIGGCKGVVGPCVWQDGQVTELGTVEGVGSAASPSGAVAGECGFTHLETHACLWHDGTVTDLGTLRPEATFSSAEAVNDRLQVVGYSGLGRPCRCGTHAFVWQNGHLTDLGRHVGNDSVNSDAIAINERGQVLGYAFDVHTRARAISLATHRERLTR